MYDGKKVKLVGYRKDCPPKYLIITYSDGWTNEEDYNVIDPSLIDSESLVNNEWRFYYVIEKQLNSLESQDVDLCELLKGCEGIELWSNVFGLCKLERIVKQARHPIVLSITNNVGVNISECISKEGLYNNGYNGECILWPSETNRDWSTFKKPVKVRDDDWVACCESIEGGFVVCRYGKLITDWKYIIPYDEFRLDLTEEDLKKLSIV